MDPEKGKGQEFSPLGATFKKHGGKEGWLEAEDVPKNAKARPLTEVIPGLQAVMSLFRRKEGLVMSEPEGSLYKVERKTPEPEEKLEEEK